MGRTACTEPQCLYKGALYLYLWSWKSRTIPLLPLLAVQPVQSLSACTRVHFTFTFGRERVELYLYSPYGPYGLYRASVPVQGCTLPLPLPYNGWFLINPLNTELNPICHLLALGAHHILHVGRIRVNAVAVDKGWFIHSHNLAKFNSHLPFAGIRSSPYSSRWQDKA